MRAKNVDEIEPWNHRDNERNKELYPHKKWPLFFLSKPKTNAYAMLLIFLPFTITLYTLSVRLLHLIAFQSNYLGWLKTR
jgi:hypothetical protein